MLRLATAYTNAYAEPVPGDFAEDLSRFPQKRIESMKFNIATMAEMEQDADARLRHLDQGDAVQGGGVGPMRAEAREFRWDCRALGSEMKTELCILERGYHVPGDQADCVHCDFEEGY